MSYTKTFNDSIAYDGYTKNNTVTTVVAGVKSSIGSRSGAKVENWREKIRIGQQAGSLFTSDRTRLLSKEVGLAQAVGTIPSNPSAGVRTQAVSGLITGISIPVTHLVASQSEANTMALTNVYKKMNSQISHMNAPAAFLEMADVVRQFGSPFRSILRLYESHINRLYLQSRGIRALKYNRTDYLRLAADTYLELAFGLQPLINDTRKAAEALARLTFEATEEIPAPKRLVGRGMSENAKSTYDDPAVAPNVWIRYQKHTIVRTKVKTQYVCGFSSFPRADLGSYDRLMQLLGFRPESWIPAVWEAVPWSWLFDYVTNVGDLLLSLEASTIKPTWIVRTDTQVSEVETLIRMDKANTRSGFSSAGWTVKELTGDLIGTHKCQRTTVQRTLPMTLGLPTLSFTLPKGTRQMLALGAVSIQALRKSKPAISLETSYKNLR